MQLLPEYRANSRIINKMTFISFTFQDPETSPVKTVLGSLAINTIHNVTNKAHNVDKEDFDNKKPVRIEDVPFRYYLFIKYFFSIMHFFIVSAASMLQFT